MEDRWHIPWWLWCWAVGVLLIALVLYSTGCYEVTLTLTGTEVTILEDMAPDGTVTQQRVPMLESRTWTKHYLLPPKGFPSEIIDDPQGARRLARETLKNCPEPPADDPRVGDKMKGGT